MADVNLVDRLAAHKTLGAAPREELEWLASHGFLRRLETGDVLTAKGSRPEGLFVVLAGRLTMFVDRGAGPRKAIEWQEGDVTGLLPYSRVMSAPGDAIAQEASEIFELHGDHVRELTERCYGLTSSLVHALVDRARAFTTSDLHDEKMVSLGKLSAGLAHELNNPASAIERSATLLQDRLEDHERATRALGAFALTGAQLAAFDAVREACRAKPASGVRSPIEHAEREEAIADWLADHGLDTGIAESLADTAVTFESLDLLAQTIEGPAMTAALNWGASGCAVRNLAAEIHDAAMRVSGLVIAIKGFTHMDQAVVAGPVDLSLGLNNTVTVLRAKARGKSAAVVVDAEAGLARVRGFGGELNQIFANLIDNALDAISVAGRVEVTAKVEGRKVVVRITDNGAGIPAEIRERIFEPFFTTKPMGQGTGLGLDIVRRLVRHNDGEISVESRPGWTQFRVALPVAETDGSGGTK
ncbi:MAG TPA: ATP-binding protein [Paludibaculum sp.]|jgi:signal transduction histidine kinase